jgi:Invasion associated locus B (IalB) protein
MKCVPRSSCQCPPGQAHQLRGAILLAVITCGDSAAQAPSTASQTPQLIYSPWAKFCGKGKDPGAVEVCFTGKSARTEAGQPVVAAALIEPEGKSQKLFRVTLPRAVSGQIESF